MTCENMDLIAMAEVTKHNTAVIHSLANQTKPLIPDISVLLTVNALVLRRDY